MADVTDYGFELSGVPFGIRQDITVEDEGFDTGEWAWNTQDTDNSKTGHTQFGRDKLQGPEWSWQLSTDMETEEDALAAMGRLATAWKAEHIRDEPGAVLRLRYRVGGRSRCVFGRPRRWAAPPTNRILGGYIPISTSFKCVDGLHYDDVEQSEIITLGELASGGGFVLPAKPPLQSLPSTDRQGIFLVGGDHVTYPKFRIEGPITNPWIEGLDFRLDFATALTASQWLEVDTAPWVNTVLRNGGVNLSTSLGRRQWLSGVRLAPGDQHITFGGSGGLGVANLRVSWRSAWNSL